MIILNRTLPPRRPKRPPPLLIKEGSPYIQSALGRQRFCVILTAMKRKSELVKKLDVPFKNSNRQALAKVYKWTEPRVHNAGLLKTFRSELRENMTPAEAAFWKLVQRSRLDGRKFRRQHSVGPYVLDFYCSSERLGIELDGEVHAKDEAAMHDLERRQFIELFHIKILRFPNRLVFDDPGFVLSKIRENFGWHATNS